MRLTLRTLLAFMDDILDADDHKHLSHKIETSDFATELIHRSRDTVRRLRLGAPDLLEPQEVIEDSGWVDPNTVAEYLDNTLVVENVAEYERVCLESDLNLAEVASCHHILTMVLGEPAEVDEKVRRRLYGMSERSAGSNQLRIERAHGGSDQAIEPCQQEMPLAHAAAADTRQTAVLARGAETVVPDYLQEAARSRRRNRRWLLVIAALVCVIGYFAWDALIPPQLPSELADTDPATLMPEVKISGSNNLAGDGVVGDDRQGEAFIAEAPETAGGEHAAGARATAKQPDSEAPPHVPAAAPSTSTSAAQATSEAPPFSPGIQGAEPDGQSTLGEPGPAESGLSAPPVPAPGQGTVDSSAAVPPPAGSSTVSTAGEDMETAVPLPDEEALEHEKPAGSEDLNLTEEPPILSGEMAISGEAAASGSGSTEEGVHGPTDASSFRAASTAGSEPLAGGAMSTVTRPTGEGSRAPITSSPGNEVEPSATASDSPVREADQTGPIQVGNYLGSDDVFVRFDPRRGAWVRMPPRSNLFTGERLLTLPKFRTQVVLAGLNLSLSGGTQILLPTDFAFLGNDNGFSHGRGVEAGHDDLLLEAVYGRMLLSAGLNGSGVVLKVGDLVCWLQMGGSAGLAVEVNRQFVPGRDAEDKPAPIAATWYLTSGTIQLSVLDGANPGPAQNIQAPATWNFVDGVIGMPQLIDQLPAWIDREPVTQTERRALTVLDDELVPDQPVGIRLLELNDRRQREVRTLAAQCSLYVGEFEPFVKALNDDQQKAAWKTLIDMLRQAIVLSPDAASGLREAFVMRRGAAAAEELMQMVRGYNRETIGLTPEAVKNGALSKLIGWLDHDSLDYRVLAYFNLQEITGKSIGYRPEYNAKQRQRGIRTWRKRLESGELLSVQ